MARNTQSHPAGGKTSEQSQIQSAHSSHQRLHPQQPNLSGRNVEKFSSGENSRKSYLREQRFRSGFSRSQPARVGGWSDHLSVQGLRLDSDAVVQLALLLVSEPCHGTGQRLDGGNLPALGCGAWSDDLMPVHWYQAPSSLKLMTDRLVCADGGNPDPTLT